MTDMVISNEHPLLKKYKKKEKKRKFKNNPNHPWRLEEGTGEKRGR